MSAIATAAADLAAAGPCACGPQAPTCGPCSARIEYWLDVGWPACAGRVSFTQPGTVLELFGAEVAITTTAPDSYRPGSAPRAWDWTNGGPDPDLLELARRPYLTHDRMASELLLLAHRCLVLNAVHEVGEWLKMDGTHVYPPHRSDWDDGPEGNGCVRVSLTYDGDRPGTPASATPATARDLAGGAGERFTRRLARLLPEDRISYSPTKTLTTSPAGPIVTDHGTVDAVTGTPTTVRLLSSWSWETASSAEAPDEVLLPLVLADLHRACVTYEVHEIGEFLHLDGRKVLDPHLSTDGILAGAPATGADACGPVRFTLDYTG